MTMTRDQCQIHVWFCAKERIFPFYNKSSGETGMHHIYITYVNIEEAKCHSNISIPGHSNSLQHFIFQLFISWKLESGQEKLQSVHLF